MEQSENIFLRVLNIFANFVFLNVLWFICCIPIITILPATTAMYGVINKWHHDGLDYGLASLFFDKFRENFRRSFITGILGLFSGFILLLNWTILYSADFNGEFFISVLFSFMLVIFVFISVYISYIIERYRQTVFESIKQALFLSISHLFLTLSCIILIIGFLLIAVYVPVFFIITGSTIAFIQYYIFDKVIKKYHYVTNK
ncbi:Uncharacterized membrane protein YesL [Gracilibacillus ureilyticus]|uniref:Uncharacterized membrane protein YesL n=1 Tax=Gracilibacillus ureilyticus TaxID=531814 RepID=A0A1H9PUZ7_9BACI|nr:YesL family protein [Gracilibacillus ureilyticus]SER51940.1 Uncharacterized membrane protein YesL [Gracilibacillus ureilyticus]